jgi:voltage-gated potassium channel
MYRSVRVNRSWLGIRGSILLSALVALLSIATGIAAIGSPINTASPLTPYIPLVVQQTAGFTGTLTGFLMLASVLLLRRGLRIGWLATMVLLPVTAGQGLLQGSEFSFPLVVLSVVAFPVVLLNYGHFDRAYDPSPTQLAAWASLVGAQVYGTAGAYALRDDFVGVDSLVDAFYFTIVTGSTVGYGDITPQSQTARLFGVSVLVVNVAAFAVFLGVLLTPAIEARLTTALGRMTDTELELLHDHVLVLGYGELTEPILQELRGEVEVVVVTEDTSRAQTLTDRGFEVLVADPSDEQTLDRANVDEAVAVVAATESDAEDALAILTARQLNPDVRIVAAATHRENVNKLKRAGADTVISPASIGARLLAESALGGAGTEAIADELLEHGQRAHIDGEELAQTSEQTAVDDPAHDADDER